GALDWSPDGRWLAVCCANGRVYVHDGLTGQVQAVLEDPEGVQSRVQFSPTGGLLAIGSATGEVRLWDPLAGTRRLTAPGGVVRFSSDGSRLAIRRDTTFGVCEVADGRECRALTCGPAGRPPRMDGSSMPAVASVDFRPDGRLLAAAGEDSLRLW